MKKVNEIIESATVVMDEETMKAIIDDNMLLVPKNQLKKFKSMPLEQQVKKIEFYKDMLQMRKDAYVKNSVPNKVKELFDKKHASIKDAQDVISFCNEYIDNYKVREIELLDAEIAKIEEMKRSILEK